MWTSSGFIWRMADSSSGVVSVFDGAAELVEFATGTLRTRAVEPVGDNADWARAMAEMTSRPRLTVLTTPGEAIVFARNWTLTRQGDNEVVVTCSKDPGKSFRVTVAAPAGLVHLKGSKVLSTITQVRFPVAPARQTCHICAGWVAVFACGLRRVRAPTRVLVSCASCIIPKG